MAITWRADAAGGGTTSTGNRTAAISATAGDLLVVGVKWSGNANRNPTCTDDQAGSYDLITTALNNSSADIMAIFIRRGLVATTATITVTPVVGSGTNTAGEIVIVACSGSLRTGKDAVRQVTGTYQVGIQENQTSGVPTPVLPAACLTGNMTLVFAGSTTTAGSVQNASWLERQDASQTTPTTCLEVSTRNSGFTGQSAAYVSIASAVWSAAIIELDPNPPTISSWPYEHWPLPEGYAKQTKTANNLRGFINPGGQSYLNGLDSIYSGQGQVPDYDWPNPNGKQYPVALRSWDQGDLLNTLLFTQPAPFSMDDWPNPRGYARSIDLLSWSQSPKPVPSTLVFRNPLYTKIEPRGFPVSLRSWDQGNLLNTLLGVVPTPFSQDDWPNPRGPRRSMDLLTWLEGVLSFPSNSLFRGPLHTRIEPKGFPVELRTWTQGNLLGTLLSLAQNPFQNYDWPNPRGATPAISLKTWLETYRMAGKDTVYGDQGQVPSYDWQNPRGAPYPQSLRHWDMGNLLSTLLSIAQPFGPYDWPNPSTGRPYPIDLRSWTSVDLLNSLLYNVPFRLLDWPVPRGAKPGVRDWTDPSKIWLLGQDRIYGGPGQVPSYDWPNPRGKPYPPHLRGWDVANLLDGLLSFIQPPFNIYDWPNPRGAQFPMELRTWLERYKLTLIGKDLLPFNQDDWPVPKGKVPVITLKTWLDLYKLLLEGKDKFYGLGGAPQFSWPNPKGAPYPAGLLVRTEPGNPNLGAPPVVAVVELNQRIRIGHFIDGFTHWSR